MAEGFLMEACVDSVESAVNAERGGWSVILRRPLNSLVPWR